MTLENDILSKQNQNIPNLTQYNQDLQSKPEPLTPEQCEKLLQLKQLIQSDEPIKQLSLNVSNLNFINDPCLLRYLRANRWSLTNSLSGLKSTMNWRQEFAVTEMKPEEFYTEGATGKIYCNGYDNDNRPIIIMNPSAQNTNDSKAHIRFTVFSIETAIKMLPNDMEKLTIIIDLRNYALKHSVSLSEAKEVLTILSSHYPERLGRAFIVDAPWVFSGFFKIISPLMDPVTKDKIRFCNGKKIDDNHLSHFVPDWNLFKDFGGKSEYTFDSDKYFEQVELLF